MSSEPTPPPKTTRVPQPISIGGGWTFLYAILAVGFLAAGIWLVVARKAGFSEPSVLVSFFGAFWFIARTFMTVRKKP